MSNNDVNEVHGEGVISVCAGSCKVGERSVKTERNILLL
jgi:hypothetical protein